MTKQEFSDFFDEFGDDVLEEFDNAIEQDPNDRRRGLMMFTWPIAEDGTVEFISTGDNEELKNALREMLAYLEGRLYGEAKGTH